MRSPATFALGIVFTAFGAVGLGVGYHFFNQGSGTCDGISTTAIPTPAQLETCQTGVIQQAGGVVGMVMGGAFLLAGIPMTIAGALPEDEPEKARYSVQVGPTGGALKVEF